MRGSLSNGVFAATAEGVETKEQLASLTSAGCKEVQGSFFSPPQPAAEVSRIPSDQAPRAAHAA